MKNTPMKTMMSALCLLLMTNISSAQDYPLRYDLPVDCSNGPTCYLQNLVDMDEGPARLDPYCARSTFNGHKGTDIRVATFKEMNAGVAVIAMADGVVGGARNTMRDVLVENDGQRQAVKGKECGNGLILSHGVFKGREWTTQYCHMKRGSVLVKKGDKIKRGQKLGLVGLSGMTQFPHIHVSVRIGKDHHDPLTGRKKGDVSCSVANHRPLFTDEAMGQLKNTNQPLIKAGFASSTVTNKQAMKNETKKPAIGAPLIYYAYMKNLLKGDRVRLTVTANGKTFVANTSKPLKVDKATFTSYVGKRSGPKSGVIYKAMMEILREGEVVFESPTTEVSF